MPQITLVLGIALVLLGVAFYIATGMVSVTALIPAIFGIVFAICGLLVMAKPTWRKHVMHLAVLVALLGAVAVGMRLVGLVTGEATFNAAAAEQLIMLVLCVAYIVLGVKSFIDARRSRTTA